MIRYVRLSRLAMFFIARCATYFHAYETTSACNACDLTYFALVEVVLGVFLDVDLGRVFGGRVMAGARGRDGC